MAALIVKTPRKVQKAKYMRQVILPDFPIEGGCQCGKLRYRLNAAPVMFYLCHCSECQRHTSSAFGESMRVLAADLEVTGKYATTGRLSDSGKWRQGHFCPSCGVRIVHGDLKTDELLNVKAGTLDDPTWLAPAGHIWTLSKQSFIAIGGDELDYPRQPDDGYAAIRRDGTR